MANPSMVPATSATRRAKLVLADHRAEAIQHERLNPVNPKRGLAKNHTGLAGSGATPSMGLSQFRGGSKKSEAHMMGCALGKHIKGLHGSSFHKDFLHGMGAVDDDEEPEGYVREKLRFDESGHRIPNTGDVNETRSAQATKNYEEKMSPSERAFRTMNKGLIEVGHMGLDKAGSVIPGSEKVAEAVRGLLPKRGSAHFSEKQRATMELSQKKAGRTHNNGPGLLSGNVDGVRGGANTGAYEGHGHSASSYSRVKRMVGAGVSARASLVKKVMAEHGLSMIEASKYVKAHGLKW